MTAGPAPATSRDLILGILGGMGPAATADFFRKLIALTPVRRDQDHVPAIISSIPQIPDRTEAILNNGPTPLPAMLRGLAMLEQCGANRIVIPCSTAHYWFDDLQRETACPILHIVDAVARVLRRNGITKGPIGLLATTATVKASVYSARLEKWGLQCLVPAREEQAAVMQAIYAVKAGQVRDHDVDILRLVASKLLDRGVGSVVMACTELPLLLPTEMAGHLTDATGALAQACLRNEEDQTNPE